MIDEQVASVCDLFLWALATRTTPFDLIPVCPVISFVNRRLSAICKAFYVHWNGFATGVQIRYENLVRIVARLVRARMSGGNHTRSGQSYLFLWSLGLLKKASFAPNILLFGSPA